MANLSNWSENAALDWLMGGSAPTRPTARYVALYTAAPSDAGGGTEVTGNGYTRQQVTCGAAASGTTSNSGVLTFAASGGAWGTITHIGVLDAASAGNLLWHGPLVSSKAVADGDSLSFAAGALDFTLE